MYIVRVAKYCLLQPVKWVLVALTLVLHVLSEPQLGSASNISLYKKGHEIQPEFEPNLIF